MIAAVVAFTGSWGAVAHAQGRDLLVFGAASLKNALDDADAQYQRDAGHKIVVSYGASSALAKQIENGAPADIFISADLDWMDYVAEHKLIKPETRFNLLGNKLVLIAPADSRINLTIGPNFPLAQALGNDRLAMADPSAVPAGKYGKAALEALGVWASVAGKIAPAQDVRATLLLVSRGEAPLGIVYQTDAAADKGVKIVGAFPESTPSADHLPDRRDLDLDQSRRRRLCRLSEIAGRQAGVREAGLRRPSIDQRSRRGG